MGALVSTIVSWQEKRDTIENIECKNKLANQAQQRTLGKSFITKIEVNKSHIAYQYSTNYHL